MGCASSKGSSGKYILDNEKVRCFYVAVMLVLVGMFVVISAYVLNLFVIVIYSGGNSYPGW